MIANKFNCKSISWITGVLGAFALIAGIGALVITSIYIHEGIREVSGANLVGPIVQVVFSVLIIIGSVLMYRGQVAGKKLLSVVVLLLLGFVLFDAISYLYEAQDYIYIINSLLLQIFPLTVLLYLIIRATVRQKSTYES